jgi:benzoyl-CoA reductase/2-hydroxyglutaryl-CoA dehydratase subunit BcrC/BadD/HgdB
MSLFLSSAERAKASGKKVVAKGPLSPVEPIYAAGALAYDPYTHETIVHAVMKENLNLASEAIDAGLGPDFNPWNLTMLGAVVSKKNEVAIDTYSTTCGCWDDQIKKSWQIMADAVEAPFHFWEVPRFDAESEKWAIKYLTRELKQFFDWLTIETDHKITDHSLMESIRRGNLLRQDIMEITQMLQLAKVPIAALEYYFAQTMIGDYAQDPEMLHDSYGALIEELKERVSGSVAAPGLVSEKPLRIYFMGEETQAFRVWNAIEDYGGVLVGCDTRLSLYYEPIKEDGSAIEDLARWIWKMPYNLPTAARIKATIPYIKQQKPDAIIISSVVGSRNIPEAERFTRDILNDELGLPMLSIETTLPLENIEKVDSRIKDFIKMNAR